MKTLLAIVLATCCLFAIRPSVLAQDELPPVKVPILMPAKFSARVDVIFDIPETIEQPFANCLLNELQSIDDVMLTTDNPQYRITIMALPNKTMEEIIGFTFSILITQPLDKNILRPFLSSKNIGEGEKKILTLIGKNYEKIEKRSLLTCSPNELGRICNEIASGFNTDVLEKDRRMWNSAWNIPGKVEDKTSPKQK